MKIKTEHIVGLGVIVGFIRFRILQFINSVRYSFVFELINEDEFIATINLLNKPKILYPITKISVKSDSDYVIAEVNGRSLKTGINTIDNSSKKLNFRNDIFPLKQDVLNTSFIEIQYEFLGFKFIRAYSQNEINSQSTLDDPSTGNTQNLSCGCGCK